jgi:choloylglycine hydrolase
MMRTTVIASLLVAGLATLSQACSRVLWNTSGRSVLVGRNMDWLNAMAVDLYTLPRGKSYDGLTGPNTLRWTSKYGSLVAGSPAGAVDGINEKGLAVNMLWLGTSNFGKYDASKPSIGVGHWLQHQLDNFATVAEAVSYMKASPYQVVPGTFDELKSMVHLAMADATGDSAIIEMLDGKAHIHHGREFAVMTNDPPYDQQLANLKNYKPFGGTKPLPGTVEAADRFVRAASYLENLPKPTSDREGVAEILSVMRGVSQPYSPINITEMRAGRPHTNPTRWRTVIDLTQKIYYYESTMSPNIIWVRLDSLDFTPKAGVRRLDLNGPEDPIGNCSGGFKPSKLFKVLKPELK